VIAILITIMVLELKVPHGTDGNALRPLVPVFLTYVLSFVMVGIYWNNHHHMLHAAERINGKVMWANLHLLFWLSLTPFITGWMGENNLAPPRTGGSKRASDPSCSSASWPARSPPQWREPRPFHRAPTAPCAGASSAPTAAAECWRSPASPATQRPSTSARWTAACGAPGTPA